jgi:DNA-binding NarL/FixJ family response regulator
MSTPGLPSRILIVDDDEKCLASMRRVLRGHFETVTTRDPVLALKIFELQGPFAVVISDFQMPSMTGIQLFSRILAVDRNTQRIMHTGHADLQMTIDAVNHGKITAFLTKPAPAVSIRSVVTDAVRCYQDSLNDVTGREMSSVTDRRLWSELCPPLTAKETEVLALLAKGFSNEEISRELGITVGTVKSHLNHLFGKMAVNSRTKVVAKSLELGLVKTSLHRKHAGP